MKAPTMFISLAGMQAAPSPAKFLVVLVKDKGAPVLRRDLVDRPYSLDCFQRHFALERRLVLLPLFAHQSLLMRHRFYILFTCPVFGEYHRNRIMTIPISKRSWSGNRRPTQRRAGPRR